MKTASNNFLKFFIWTQEDIDEKRYKNKWKGSERDSIISDGFEFHSTIFIYFFFPVFFF